MLCMSLLPPLLGLALTLAVFAGLITLGLRRIRVRRELNTRGIRIQAEITTVQTRSIGPTWAYYPTVRYHLYGQLWQSKPASGQLALNPRGVKSHKSGDQFIGDYLDIVVDPHNPASSAVRHRDRLAIVMVVTGSVFGGLSLLLGIIGITANILFQR